MWVLYNFFWFRGFWWGWKTQSKKSRLSFSCDILARYLHLKKKYILFITLCYLKLRQKRPDKKTKLWIFYSPLGCQKDLVGYPCQIGQFLFLFITAFSLSSYQQFTSWETQNISYQFYKIITSCQTQRCLHINNKNGWKESYIKLTVICAQILSKLLRLAWLKEDYVINRANIKIKNTI